jgi:DNA-binding transcriptional regulator YiaG
MAEVKKAKKLKKAKKPGASLGGTLIKGMEDIIADSEGRDVGVIRYTIPPGATAEEVGRIRQAATDKASARKTKLPPPPDIHAQNLQQIRELLRVSQQMFADYLGVSVALVRAWEGGTRVPKGADRRLLADMLARPEYWAGQVEMASRQT